jgi:hypothetical protein
MFRNLFNSSDCVNIHFSKLTNQISHFESCFERWWFHFNQSDFSKWSEVVDVMWFILFNL